MKLTLLFLGWAGSGLLIAATFSIIRHYQKKKNKEFFYLNQEFEYAVQDRPFPSRIKGESLKKAYTTTYNNRFNQL